MGGKQRVQAVLDEIRRTVAEAAGSRSSLSVESEASRLARRHPTALIPLHEVRRQLIEMAAEQHVRLETA